MFDRMRQFYEGSTEHQYELQEKLFRFVLILSIGIMVLGNLETAIVTGEFAFVFPIFLGMIVMGFIVSVLLKKGKTDIAILLVGLLLAFVMFPVSFFFNGGIQGGASVWLTVPFIYSYLLLSGRKRKIFLGLVLLDDVIVFLVAYFHPEYIVPMDNVCLAYVDTFFSIIIVEFVWVGSFDFRFGFTRQNLVWHFSKKRKLRNSAIPESSFSHP